MRLGGLPGQEGDGRELGKWTKKTAPGQDAGAALSPPPLGDSQGGQAARGEVGDGGLCRHRVGAVRAVAAVLGTLGGSPPLLPPTHLSLCLAPF